MFRRVGPSALMFQVTSFIGRDTASHSTGCLLADRPDSLSLHLVPVSATRDLRG